MNLEELRTDAEKFLSETVLSNLIDKNGQRYLQVPGHLPHFIPAYERSSGVGFRFKKSKNVEFYEATTTLILSFLLSRFKPKTVFDVGASSGYFSFLASTHIETAPKVYAFDMRPDQILALNARTGELGLGNKVTGHLAGLSDEHHGNKRIWYARTLMFEEKPTPSEFLDPWYVRLKFTLHGKSTKERGLKEAIVFLTSLDAFCDANQLEPGVIKIDVDGYEGKVVKGAKALMRDVRPVFVLELHKDSKQRFGILRRDVTQLFFDADYDALFLTDHHDPRNCCIVPVSINDPLLARQKTDMILLIPRR